MGLSFIGVLLLQIHWIKSSYVLNKESFRENVNKSLLQVIDYMTLNEKKVSQSFNIWDINGKWSYKSSDSLFNIHFYVEENPDFKPPIWRDDVINNLNTLSKTLETYKFKDSIVIQDYLLTYTTRSFRKRPSMHFKYNVDSLLHLSLLKNGINLPYSFGIFDKEIKRGSKWIDFGGNEKTDTIALKKSPYNYIWNKRQYEVPEIYMTFSDENQFIYKELSFTLIASFLLVLITFFSFWYSLRIIMRQKKLSQIKTDFINNMTHEFKTPLATIGIAAATIEEDDIIKNKTAIKKFTKAIKEENNRMNRQVEMVLNSAKADVKDFKLKTEEIDLHKMIQNIVSHTKLIMKKRGGIISVILQAKYSIIKGDSTHIYQVINNLINNAYKYSKEVPEISIYSENTDEGVLIHIKDKGLGISKESQKMVFEKFFRVSTKDLHNVKGFGLGLSYAKTIIEAHGGNIKLKSVLHQGSTFSIFLPFHTKKL